MGLISIDTSEYYDQWTSDEVNKADISVTRRPAIL